MSDKFIIYHPDGADCGDFVAFNGAYGESILTEAECVKMLNGFNNTCDKLTEQNKMLREALALADSWLEVDADYDESPLFCKIRDALGAAK